MEVNKFERKMKMSKVDLIKYQVITELIFIKKEHVIPSDVELLTLLALWGPVEMGKFCNAAARQLYQTIEPEEFSVRAQNVRNRITKLQKRGLVVKRKDSRRLIQLDPSIPIHSKGNVLLSHNFLSLEPNKA